MKTPAWRHYQFDPARHERELAAIVEEVRALPNPDRRAIDRILRRHPKGGTALFSNSEVIAGYRYLADRYGWTDEASGKDGLVAKLRMKPVRSLSGVTPVTILTKPFPCPGRCVFCPSDVRMPKSYLSREPGAQRAGMHNFDPYDQTRSRLEALHRIGHPVDKVELIVLGGTWSFYDESYQRWFLKRTFEALNDFGGDGEGDARSEAFDESPVVDYSRIDDEVDGRRGGNRYNRVVDDFVRSVDPGGLTTSRETASWNELLDAQRANERARSRMVGLSLETRPDYVTEEEVERLRRLGATKIQIGYQSLSDDVLEKNQRGHDVAASRRATRLLRAAGFKVQAHWMANLYGSTPSDDVEDFRLLFDDPDFRPDELKLYPCSLIESAELMVHYEKGRYRPYSEVELLEILVSCMTYTPKYCRLTRVIRDIPGEDILDGSRVTNFRDVAEKEVRRRSLELFDIRAREIRGAVVDADTLGCELIRYRTSIGEEVFIEFVTEDDRLAAFLRLGLPEPELSREHFLPELRGRALVREVHVYGASVNIGHRDDGRAQHSGLGRRLLDEAESIARKAGFESLAVISSVGTREYYRKQGFVDGTLYQHRAVGRE